MFSVNRFDPKKADAQNTIPSSFNPLARLNARLEAAKQLTGSTSTLPTSSASSIERPPLPTINQTELYKQSKKNKIHDGDDQESIIDPSKPIPKKQKARLDLGFTGANTIPLPSLEGPKHKTKAKLKYLKRKKERLKSRKRVSAGENKKQIKQEVPPCDHPPSEILDQQQTEVSEELNPDTTSILSTSSKPQEPPPERTDTAEKPKRSKRPKNLDVVLESISRKKRKQESSTSDQVLGKHEQVLHDDEKDDPSTSASIEQISQPGALPRFPAPINPSLPDPQLLARLAMGLGDIDITNSNPEMDQDFVQFDSQANFKLSEIPTRSHEPGKFIESLSLSHHSISRLKQLEYDNLLAVQIAVFSLLMPPLSAYPDTPASSLYPIRKSPRDLCVSAPTGSGKTLSYIIPIVETLSSRVVCRLRALIVLPTRDLVLQVKNTFDCFSKGTGLKVAIVTGQHSFTREQALIGATRDGSEGLVDVVIATPGRLVDHLNFTSGFSLEHLCFLVLDEADQLLNKSQAWLNQVLSTISTKRGFTPQCNNAPNHESLKDPVQSDGSFQSEPLNLWNTHPKSTDCDSTISFHHYKSRNLPIETFNPCRLRPFRILLFSATLKRDPVKLGHLGLRRPIFVKVSSKNANAPIGKKIDDLVDELNGYCLPKSLKQHIIVTTTSLKPLVFFKLIKSKRITKSLCFCKSIEGATRLTSLCKLMQDQLKLQSQSRPSTEKSHEDDLQLFNAECFSSELNPTERKKILNRFQTGQTNLLICSDMIARGIDIPKVLNVMNYDTPIDIKKYIHRVGRTARANEIGSSYTIIESQEAKFVKRFLRVGLGDQTWNDPNRISKLRFNWIDIQDLLPFYNVALKKLGEMFQRSIDL